MNINVPRGQFTKTKFIRDCPRFLMGEIVAGAWCVPSQWSREKFLGNPEKYFPKKAIYMVL